MKKYLLIPIIFFIYIFLTDYLIHGVILKQVYIQTAQFWRPDSEMKLMFKWMMLGQLLVAFSVTSLYQVGRFYSSAVNTASFAGALLVFRAACNLIMYVVSPYPFSLVKSWIGLEGVQIILGSILLFILFCKERNTLQVKR